ncbi:hypothetical protein D3C86_2086030 [compost metagenome]
MVTPKPTLAALLASEASGNSGDKPSLVSALTTCAWRSAVRKSSSLYCAPFWPLTRRA